MDRRDCKLNKRPDRNYRDISSSHDLFLSTDLDVVKNIQKSPFAIMADAGETRRMIWYPFAAMLTTFPSAYWSQDSSKVLQPTRIDGSPTRSSSC